MPDRFVWQATDRTTGTIYTEDEQGLGSFSKLNAWNVSRVSVLELDLRAGGYHGFHHDVPEGAAAVFTRRRVVSVGPRPDMPEGSLMAHSGWTIIGHRWPDTTGDYYFFSDAEDFVYHSDNFHWV